MNGEAVLYQGRHVLKEGFRAFVYGHDGATLLVNSWDEFTKACSSGLWFASNKEVPEKTKSRKKSEE
jgi:hypothetical protein